MLPASRSRRLVPFPCILFLFFPASTTILNSRARVAQERLFAPFPRDATTSHSSPCRREFRTRRSRIWCGTRGWGWSTMTAGTGSRSTDAACMRTRCAPPLSSRRGRETRGPSARAASARSISRRSRTTRAISSSSSAWSRRSRLPAIGSSPPTTSGSSRPLPSSLTKRCDTASSSFCSPLLSTC